jgi:hypothetical protein
MAFNKNKIKVANPVVEMDGQSAPSRLLPSNRSANLNRALVLRLGFAPRPFSVEVSQEIP